MSVSFQCAVSKSYDVLDVKRDAMSDSKILRSQLPFMQRMENDSYNKRVNNQLSTLREQDENLKQRVDKIALEKTTNKGIAKAEQKAQKTGDLNALAAFRRNGLSSRNNGGVAPPRIVTHHRNKQFEGFGKKTEWGPLDGY